MNKMNKTICVFCSSSDKIDSGFVDEAEKLGRLIADNGYSLVYGGATNGLMGTLAKTVHSNGAKVIGVIPEMLKDKEFAYEKADELIVTVDMRDRKTIMEQRSDAFIALPGGFGTLEELLEIVTLKLLKYHNKPVVIINTNDFYNPLINLFDHIIKERFAKPASAANYKVVSSSEEAFSYIKEVLNVG